MRRSSEYRPSKKITRRYSAFPRVWIQCETLERFQENSTFKFDIFNLVILIPTSKPNPKWIELNSTRSMGIIPPCISLLSTLLALKTISILSSSRSTTLGKTSWGACAMYYANHNARPITVGTEIENIKWSETVTDTSCVSMTILPIASLMSTLCVWRKSQISAYLLASWRLQVVANVGLITI